MENKTKNNKNRVLLIVFALMITIVTTGLYISWISSRNEKCPTDINKDGRTDSGDLVLLGKEYGKECKGILKRCSADINKDGIMNKEDMELLEQAFNSDCPD